MIRRRLIVPLLAALFTLLLASPALAHDHQVGLVNVNVGDVVVQAPIAVAANLCDVNINVLSVQLRDGGAECDADADSDAVYMGDDGDSAPVSQIGLVNVNIDDVIVQLPIALALNVCDANVNVLALQFRAGGATCTAEADSDAGA